MSNEQRGGEGCNGDDQRLDRRLAPGRGAAGGLPVGAGGPDRQNAPLDGSVDGGEEPGGEFEVAGGTLAEDLLARAHGLMGGPRRGRARRTVRAQMQLARGYRFLHSKGC
ncbi:MAG: hypothetical protein IPK60_20560 [Sandaracinaceae bacterium]|nr:hypothetical protein [Sandaracinaceae bacterium]